MAARRNQEILAARRRDEPLQPVIIRINRSGGTSAKARLELLEVQRGLVYPHGPEEIGSRHKDRELQLGLLGTVGHVARAEARAIHTNVDGRAIMRPRRLLERRKMTHT